MITYLFNMFFDPTYLSIHKVKHHSEPIYFISRKVYIFYQLLVDKKEVISFIWLQLKSLVKTGLQYKAHTMCKNELMWFSKGMK